MEGRCVSNSAFEYCSVSTGDGDAQLHRVTCRQGESCRVDAEGFADCVLTGTCREGDTACDGTTTLRVCSGGRWVSRVCNPGRCISTPLGSDCNTLAATRPFSGQIFYEARSPRPDRRDWGPLRSFVAQELLVLTLRDRNVIDVQRTDREGRFTVQVPTSVTADDVVAFAAAGIDPMTRRISYVVADPRLGEGRFRVNMTSQRTLKPRLWAWQWNVRDLRPTLTITEGNGSGAARVYDYLRYSYNQMRDYFGTSGKSLVVWVGMGTSWNCGACFNTTPLRVFDIDFESQVWLDGSTVNQGYWADAVTAHEFGHWVMASYSRAPNEGGPHTLGIPVFPGMAWSEGWATFMSSDIRNDPVYIDKQDGSMFWFDIEARRYGSGRAWNHPAPARLLDRIDENEVASMLWALSDSAVPPIYAALSTPRMRRAPFGRCYTRHVWRVNEAGQPVDVCATTESAPHFADYLDALSCGGFSRAAISASIGSYPYPVNSPYCATAVRPSTCAASTYPRCR